jgi:hypothetical protein
LIALPIMYKLGDLKSLLNPHNNNWALIIPFGSILIPLLAAGRGQESSLPLLLVVPSLFYFGIFSYSMLIDLIAWEKKQEGKPPPRINSQRSFV